MLIKSYFFHYNHACVLLNISALRVQYGIQAFAKFKRPERTRLHLGELQFQKLSWGNMPPDPLESHAVGAPDGRYGAHIATILYLSAMHKLVANLIMTASKIQLSLNFLPEQNTSFSCMWTAHMCNNGQQRQLKCE